MKHFAFIFILAFIGMASLSAVTEQIETAVYLASENNDKIGKNATYLFDEVGGYFEVKTIKPANSNSIKGFSIVYMSDKEDSWQFKFVIPAQQSIVLGKDYRNALSYPYQSYSNAGIKVCRVFQDFNDLKGDFKILEYSLGSNGEITSLAIDFKQVAGNEGVLNGSIRYHSNKPLTTDFNSNDGWQEFYPHYFEFFSSPGEYFGEGKHVISKDGPIYPIEIGSHSYSGLTRFYTRDPDSKWLWWVDFAPVHAPLRIEKGFYLNTRHPNNIRHLNVLNLDCNWKLCYNPEGSFEVLEIEYDQEGKVEKLALDFVLSSEYSRDKLIRVTIRYNSYIPPSTEEQIKAKLG